MTLSGCSAQVVVADAGYDAGAVIPDAGHSQRDAGTPWGDAGCILPSDFPWDAGFVSMLADSACGCVSDPQVFHCFEEDGPRCFSWACPPALDSSDGGYRYDTPDGGLLCLC
jgi:hypothetical protein